MNAHKESLCFFWDLQNCAIPSKIAPYDCVTRVRSTVLKLQSEVMATTTSMAEVSFNAYCDVSCLSQDVRQELSRARVTIRDVASRKAGAADILLLQDILRHAMTHRTGLIVLISGDIDFAETVHDLVHTGGYKVILIHNKQARMELRKNASKAVSFDEIVKSSGNTPNGNTSNSSDSNNSNNSNNSKKSSSSNEGSSKREDNKSKGEGNRKKDPSKKGSATATSSTTRPTSQVAISTWNCNECGKSFQSEASLDQHSTATGHEAKVPCPECQKLFGNLNSLAQHIEATKHCKNTKWRCPRCKNEKFKSLKKLLAHLQELDAATSGSSVNLNSSIGSKEHRATCDVCSKQIIGIRYKCLDCRDYDECSKCRGDNNTCHAEGHMFYALKDPSSTIPDDELKKHRRPKDGSSEYFERWVPQPWRSDPVAISQYQQACSGSRDAQYWMASCFATGVFGEPNGAKRQEQLYWGLKAARQGHCDAQFMVALQYYQGQGTQKNLEKAQKWMTAAANQGHERARAWIKPTNQTNTPLDNTISSVVKGFLDSLMK